MQIEKGVVHRGRRHNSSYPTQRHLLIANYTELVTTPRQDRACTSENNNRNPDPRFSVRGVKDSDTWVYD